MADHHIKMESVDNGFTTLTKWLETESSGERTFIFEAIYDKDGTCVSEELVGWSWGEIETEEEVKEIAKEHNLKAEYTL